jgi:prepilin-type N-terminal cleavage/methylation domain-containing protein
MITMTRRHAARGFTLIESMMGLAILLVGALGVTGISDLAFRMNADARRMTRATAIAQDLLENIQLWPYQDNVAGTPLANTTAVNDGDIGDTAFRFTTDASPKADGLADHDETDVAALGTAWTGIPAAQLGEYQRYWNVTYQDTNGNGVNDVVQIAVVVRWPTAGGGWRRVVLLSAKLNPGGS